MGLCLSELSGWHAENTAEIAFGLAVAQVEGELPLREIACLQILSVSQPIDFSQGQVGIDQHMSEDAFPGIQLELDSLVAQVAVAGNHLGNQGWRAG